jgi:DNA-binding Lrp family transcriptional regulator
MLERHLKAWGSCQDLARHGVNDSEQWAKVPEWAAYRNLDATAWNVLIILASKAGRDRVAWITQVTIGERLGKTRQSIGKAIRRLEKAGLVKPAGTVVINRELGTWVRKYKVAPYLPEATPRGASGGNGKDPMQLRKDPMQLSRGPDATPGVSHSVPQGSVPQRTTVYEEKTKGECPACPDCSYLFHERNLLPDQRLDEERAEAEATAEIASADEEVLVDGLA